LRTGSMYLMLSMWGSQGTWSKKDGVGQVVIFWWIQRLRDGGFFRR
jgi:hypothetical protein